MEKSTRAFSTTSAAGLLVLMLSTLAQAGQGDCSQPLSTGATPKANDCLYILKTSVELESCDPECICDTNGNGVVQTSDALRCLRVSVNDPGSHLECECEEPTTTTTTTLPPPQCADLDGDWIGGGSGSACCTIDGDSFCDTLFGAGPIEIFQSGCYADFTVGDDVFQIYLDFGGLLTFSKWTFSGEWFPDPEDYGLSCSKNFVKGDAVINSSATRLNVTYTGAMTCSGEGHSFTCTASGKETWAR